MKNFYEGKGRRGTVGSSGHRRCPRLSSFAALTLLYSATESYNQGRETRAPNETSVNADNACIVPNFL